MGLLNLLNLYRRSWWSRWSRRLRCNRDLSHLKETKRTSNEWPWVLGENRGPLDRAIHIYSLEYIKQRESHAFRHIPTLNQLPLGILAGLNCKHTRVLYDCLCHCDPDIKTVRLKSWVLCNTEHLHLRCPEGLPPSAKLVRSLYNKCSREL